MLRGRRHVERAQALRAESRNLTKELRIPQVRLGVFAEIASERLDALAFDANDRTPGADQPPGERQPRHPGRLQDHDDLIIGRQAVAYLLNELA